MKVGCRFCKVRTRSKWCERWPKPGGGLATVSADVGAHDSSCSSYINNPSMGEEVQQNWKQKLLFYTTASFVLLGVFSLFSFLFLVPFVIDPAFTTIYMKFDEEPAHCMTARTDHRLGASNCSWTSCREGCTKDIYDCTQIFVNYRIESNRTNISVAIQSGASRASGTSSIRLLAPSFRRNKGRDEYSDYEDDVFDDENADSTWSFRGARLLPNVKGCGYPPVLNCSIFYKKYRQVGTNYSCYYSTIDPSMVISNLDMWQVYLNLIYAMAIPIPSFIVSVVYLAFAYFKIYNEDDEELNLEKAIENGLGESEHELGDTPIPPPSGGITPASDAFREDLASFGHHLKVAMVDELSRDSLADGVLSLSIGG